jgi:hypothetical protein
VNGTPVSSVAGFRAELKKAGAARFARFYVHRPGPRPANFIAAVRLKD